MFSLKIALRFLRSSKLQTILIIFAIIIGVSVQVFVGSLIGSLQSSLINTTVGSSPDVTITPLNGTTIPDLNKVVDEVRGVSGVTVVSETADSSAFLNQSGKTYNVLLRGLDLNNSTKIYHLGSAIYEGAMPTTEGQVLVGRDLQSELGVKVGDKITITTPALKEANLTISGFYDLGVSSINKAWLITSLSTAQGILGLGSNVTSIEIQVQDIFSAGTIASSINSTIAEHSLQVTDWESQNQQLLSGLQGQTISSLLIQVFVLASVLVAITAILIISVVQKSRQLGILKAMGIKDRTASAIFLEEGFILGLIGSIGGVGVGIGLLVAFTTFAKGTNGAPIISITIDPSFILISAAVAVIAATVAAVIPARSSAKLSPIEVIKNG